MKKILTLNIYVDETTNKVTAEMKHRCNSKDDALRLIQEFVDRKKRKKAEAQKGGIMPNEKKLALKKKLFAVKKDLREKVQDQTNKYSLNEKRIYIAWLESVNELIDICIDRNKF